VFDNTNILLPRDAIEEPHVPADVRAAVQRKGISVKAFDLVIVIDLDPGRFSGGVVSTDTDDVYVGNFGHWPGALSQARVDAGYANGVPSRGCASLGMDTRLVTNVWINEARI
jgi:hypothetical protein